MANPSTWAELKEAIASWLVRDDQEDRIPEYISLAESRLERAVNGPERDTSTTLTAADTVALPSDFGGVKALWIETDPKTTPDFMPYSTLRQVHSSAATGIPSNYTISGSSLIFGPAPDSAYDVTLVYRKALLPLSETNATNWLLAAHPDLYLAASLTEAFLALVDDRAVMWDSRTEAKIQEVNSYGRRKQYGGTPQRIRSPIVV